MYVNKQNQIELLKNKTGVSTFNSISKEKFDEIQRMMISENKFTQQELSLLVELMPNFVELQKDFIDAVKKIAEQAGSSQKSAFDVIDKQMAILETLAKSAQTDETRSDIAKTLLKISENTNEILKEMNANNNEFWKYITGAAVAIGAVVGGLFLMKDKK